MNAIQKIKYISFSFVLFIFASCSSCDTYRSNYYRPHFYSSAPRYTSPTFYPAYQTQQGEIVSGSCGEDPYAGIRNASPGSLSGRTLPYSFNSSYWIVYK